MQETFYHTQEAREKILFAPVLCNRNDAWLGEAIYFWYDIEDAEHWGNTSKRRTGYYEIYESVIFCENILNSVFNEEHYFFWYRQIEKVAKIIIAKTKMKPTIKELNDYFKERGTWNEVDGILFQDLPTNNERLLIKPIEYQNKKMVFAYRKRIQLAVYNREIIRTFDFFKREKCT
jgi:hypothetical protein